MENLVALVRGVLILVMSVTGLLTPKKSKSGETEESGRWLVVVGCWWLAIDGWQSQVFLASGL